MKSREQLLKSPDYWFEDAQNELYRQVVAYMEKKGLNQTQLAEKLGVSKGYISQVLKASKGFWQFGVTTAVVILDLSSYLKLVHRRKNKRLF